MANSTLRDLHALADTLPSSDAFTLRAAAAEILELRGLLRDILQTADNARLPPSLRRRAQMVGKGWQE
jgi:hypothetical protein